MSPEEIKTLLARNNRAVERAILAIYQRQTSEEKKDSATKTHNGVGFNSHDARLGTYYAKWLNSGNRLSGVHLDKARRIAIRYSRQLSEIAEEKEAEKIVSQLSYEEEERLGIQES